MFVSKFDTLKIHLNFSVQGKQFYSEWKTGLKKNHVYRKSKSLELKLWLYISYDEHKVPINFNTNVYFKNWSFKKTH